jgi:hypothetical protein
MPMLTFRRERVGVAAFPDSANEGISIRRRSRGAMVSFQSLRMGQLLNDGSHGSIRIVTSAGKRAS